MAKTRKLIEGDFRMLQHLDAVRERLESGELKAAAVASVDLSGEGAYWYIDPALDGKLGALEQPLSELLVLYRTNMDIFNEKLDVPAFNKSTCEH